MPSNETIANLTDERPYTICHVMASIDGRISGAFMANPAAGPALRAYERLRGEYGADAVAYGTTTTREFVGARAPKLPSTGVAIPDGDYVSEEAAAPFYVSVDASGKVAWGSNSFTRPGKQPMHVVEVLTAKAPVEYRAYLRQRGISYIIAGSDGLDCREAAEKLHRLFGIRTMLLCGGGVVDWSFLQAGVLDELSVVVAPVAEGTRSTATVFDESPYVPASSPKAFVLEVAERLEGDALRLVYRRA